MNHMFEKYPTHLALEVSTDNIRAMGFYSRIGLTHTETYFSQDKVEFAKFETVNFQAKVQASQEPVI